MSPEVQTRLLQMVLDATSELVRLLHGSQKVDTILLMTSGGPLSDRASCLPTAGWPCVVCRTGFLPSLCFCIAAALKMGLFALL